MPASPLATSGRQERHGRSDPRKHTIPDSLRRIGALALDREEITKEGIEIAHRDSLLSFACNRRIAALHSALPRRSREYAVLRGMPRAPATSGMP